jgi:hypothetical protein
MFSLVAAGGLPGELTSLVWKLFGAEGQSLNTVLQDGQDAKNFALLVEKFIPAVLVSVKVGAESDCDVDDAGILRGQLALLDIADIDKNQIFLYGIGVIRGDEEAEVVARDLDSFRPEPARPDAGSGSAAVQPAAVPAGGNGAA